MTDWVDRLSAAEPAPSAQKPASTNWADRLVSTGADMQLDPTADESKLQNFRAGLGRAVSSAGTRLVQLLQPNIEGTFGPEAAARWKQKNPYYITPKDVEETRKLDAPLLANKQGFWGDVVGSGVTTLPLAAVPGSGQYKTAMTLGALANYLTHPSTGWADTAENAGMGAAGGALGNAAGRILASGYGALKGLISPFFKSGQSSIIQSLVNSFEPDAARAAAAIRKDPGVIVPGSEPTTAEAAGTVGLGRLQKAVAQRYPEFGQALKDRIVEQTQARVNAIGDVAGSTAERNFLDANRSAVADQMYGAARKAGIDPRALTPEAQANMAAMQKRLPQDVLEYAKNLATMAGEPLDNTTSLQGLHWIKKALDSKISTAGTAGDDTTAKALTGLKNDLVDGMSNLSPLYDAARQAFIDNSKRINQIDVGQELYNKLVPASREFGDKAPLSLQSYARGLRDADAVAQKALGMPSATINDILDPKQITVLQNIAQDLSRSSNATRNAATPGSDTVSNAVSQNMIDQVLGPLGAPPGWRESTLLQSLLRPLQWAADRAEPRIMSDTSRLLLNPTEMQRLLLAPRPNPAQLGNRLGALGTASGMGFLPSSYADQKSLTDAEQ